MFYGACAGVFPKDRTNIMMGAVKKLGEIFNVFPPPLRSKTHKKLLIAASPGSTSHLAMKLKNSMELPHVAARLLLKYKMRSRSSTSSILYTTVPPSKNLREAADVCCSFSERWHKSRHEKCVPEIEKSIHSTHGLSAPWSHYADKSGQMLQHFPESKQFGDFFMLACDNAGEV